MTNDESSAGITGVPAKKRRYQRRTVYLPQALKGARDAQSVAHHRCLMILSVLSGHRTVVEALAEGKLTRPQYYQLEDRAVQAMMRSLDPMASESSDMQRELRRARVQIQALSTQVRFLTQRKRSAERLLRLVVKSSRVPLEPRRRGRPPKELSVLKELGADSP
jgi:phage shock protein A